MSVQSLPVGAAIDVGSNTIHIVVAHYSPQSLDILADEVEMVRIGESVTVTGAISQQKQQDAIAVLRSYKTLAEQHAANPILTVATEAIREASNSQEFIEAVRRETGLEVQLIDGNVEAALTFYGASYELYREPDAPATIGVMDLGGGSTELVIARQQEIDWRTSIPVGSGWLHDRYLPSNPPTRDELSVAETFLQTYFQGLPVKHFPATLIVTGGSANSLLRVARGALGIANDETRLTRDDLVRCEGLLYTLRAEEIARRYDQPLERARILPAGALIIRMAMARLDVAEMHVSPHGIREGALLALGRYGEQWLQRVAAEAQQHDTDLEVDNVHLADEPFAQSGRHLLLDRTRNLLKWRKEVLKQDDIEAVHKMRVATRRLRAVLDAYESACDPRPFKKVYRKVKDLADVLGNARDTDVMIANLESQLKDAVGDERAALLWLVARLRDYREQRQDAIVEFFDDFDSDRFEELVASCIREGGAKHGKG